MGQPFLPPSFFATRKSEYLSGLHYGHGRRAAELGVIAHVVASHVMSERLLLLAIGATALSGVPALFLSRVSAAGQWVATAWMATGAGLGFAGVGAFWATGNSRAIVLPWAMFGVDFHVAMDGLSAIFLVPIFLIAALGSIYGH